MIGMHGVAPAVVEMPTQDLATNAAGLAFIAPDATDHIYLGKDNCTEAASGVVSFLQLRLSGLEAEVGSDTPFSISSVVLGNAHYVGGGTKPGTRVQSARQPKEMQILQNAAAEIPLSAGRRSTAHAESHRALQRRPHSFLKLGF